MSGQLSYEQALACYFDVFGENADIPAESLSERRGDGLGWRLANVNGFLAVIGDDGRVYEDESPTFPILVAEGSLDAETGNIFWVDEHGDDVSYETVLRTAEEKGYAKGDDLHIALWLNKEGKA